MASDDGTNAVVEPIHPKPMPVDLTDRREARRLMRAPWDEAKRCSDRCPDEALRSLRAVSIRRSGSSGMTRVTDIIQRAKRES